MAFVHDFIDANNLNTRGEGEIPLPRRTFFSFSFSHITMNLPNKLTGVFFTLGLGLLLTGCESMFHDDLENCPQAVYVKLYTNTACKADPIGLNTQSNVHLFAFDEENRLAASTELKDIDLGNPEKGLTEIKLPIKNATPDQDRVYNIYAWTGVNGKFNVQEPKIGVKKDELFASLKTDADAAYMRLGQDRVYQGTNSHPVLLKNPAKNGAQEEHIAIAVGEKTYRLNISVVLDRSIRNRASSPSTREFGVEIASANATYNYDASHHANSAVSKYAPNSPIIYGDTALIAKYTLLDLQTGLKSTVRITNQKNGERREVQMPQEIKQDLIAAILAYASNEDNKFGFNLDCEHDIDIKFLIKDKCVDCGDYMCAGVFINDWLVHTFKYVLE